MAESDRVTYPSYLRLPELLGLQHPLSDPPEHDELLFITIHQVYELWFKLLLHELDKARRDLSADRLYPAIHTFKRLRTVMKTLVGQLDILETMTPRSFGAFRDRLTQASGFQSMQFREIEFLLGYKRAEILEDYPADLPGIGSVRRRLTEPTLVDALYDLMEHRGAAIPSALRAKDPTAPNAPDDRVADEASRLYVTRPQLALLFELMLDFDEGLQEWRYRHLQLTRRVIGDLAGTGGSAGARFLESTLLRPVFPDLWGIATRM